MAHVLRWLSYVGRCLPSSRTGQVILVAAGSTIVVLSAAGLYLRRRRRKYTYHSGGADEAVDYNRLRSTTVMSPYANSTVATVASSVSHTPRSTSGEDRYAWRPASQFQTTEELCGAGLQAIQASVDYWHAAVTRFRNRAVNHESAGESSSGSEPDSFATVQRLESLIDHAHRMEEMYQQHFLLFHPEFTSIGSGGSSRFSSLASGRGLRQPVFSCSDSMDTAASAAIDGAAPLSLGELSGADANVLLRIDRPHPSASISDSSSLESFVSATMQLDSPTSGVHSPMDLSARGLDISYYLKGEEAVRSGSVPCRTTRTHMLQCPNDKDFLAKLFCVREAFQFILTDQKRREWIVSAGCRLITLFLQAAGKESQAFTADYQALMAYVESTDIDEMFEELGERRVVCFSFYDVVLDFALMDAFADLENPPSTITSVLANRWLTDGFKETALNTAVWSVLKAKRSLLQKSDGFMHHFYSVMSTLTPILAWGFLGPNQSLRGQCAVFKDQLLHLMRDIFSLTTVRYTSLEDLSDDIMDSTTMTYQQLVDHFQASVASRSAA